MAGYNIEYYDEVNVLHQILIGTNNPDNEFIQGTVSLSYPSINEVLDPIRGSGLTLYLEADQANDFRELYLAPEKTITVQYERDGKLLFYGFINPENWYEDFVSDRWVTTVECTDGLGFLADLAFVDSNGLPFVGRMKQSEVLIAALKRTGVPIFRIAASINIFYDGLAETEGILSNVFVNADRYIKSDGGTIMSCEDVIKDIIEPYGGIVTFFEGTFSIVKPNELAKLTQVTFKFYYEDGTVIDDNKYYDFQAQIKDYQGSTYWLHYANENQSLSLSRAVSAYRINYKYGLLESLTPNPNLVTNDGVTYDGWTIDDTNAVTVPSAGGYGAKFSGVLAEGVTDPLLTSDGLPFLEDEDFSFRITFDVEYEIEFAQFFGSFQYQILLVDGGTTYYLNAQRQWDGVPRILTEVLTGQSQVNIFVNADPLIVGGELQIRIIAPQQEEPIKSDNTNFEINLTSADIVNNRVDDDLVVVGEFHTLERSNPPSSRVLEGKEVYTGDLLSAAYRGTTYQADGDTPTENWHRKGVDESKPLLRIMGEETLRINGQVARLFRGDIYGYLPYLSVVDLEGIANNFVTMEYMYDTSRNITSVVLKEVFSEELTDILYTKSDDYGETVEPTIVG